MEAATTCQECDTALDPSQVYKIWTRQEKKYITYCEQCVEHHINSDSLAKEIRTLLKEQA